MQILNHLKCVGPPWRPVSSSVAEGRLNLVPQSYGSSPTRSHSLNEQLRKRRSIAAKTLASTVFNSCKLSNLDAIKCRKRADLGRADQCFLLQTEERDRDCGKNVRELKRYCKSENHKSLGFKHTAF